ASRRNRQRHDGIGQTIAFRPIQLLLCGAITFASVCLHVQLQFKRLLLPKQRGSCLKIVR
ncbi:MAG: hypothetical protein DME56_10300, partial [Verrucomicrobia bacterium]